MVVLLATGGYDNTIRFWDASSGICYKTLQHADKQVRPAPPCRAVGQWEGL